MTKPEPPKPPPMRCMLNYSWVNEWELVDWYTDAGKLYDRIDLNTRKSNWFLDLFKRDYQIKLYRSLMKNQMMCMEWRR